MICWMVALIPWYLIGTAFVMPLIIGGSDGCTTGTNIAVNYMVADGSSICKDFGGKGTVSACRFTGNDIDVTVDLLGMVQGVFGDCPSADPFAVPLKTLSEQFRSIPRERVERELRKDENLRQRMKDIAINAADDLSIVAREFIDTNADEVISCARIATVWQELKAPACDATAGASAWLIGMLYLAGWTMCCCGLPSTCYMQGHNEWSDFEKLDEPEDRSSQYTAEAPPDREAILLQHQDSYASDLSDQNEGRDGHASSTIRDKPSNGASAPPDNGEIPYATIAIPYGNHGDQHSRNSSGNNNATVVVIHSDEML